MRFLIFLLFISSVSFAQTWEATIVDQNQKPIDGIVISTTDTTFVSIDGSFSISNLSNSDSISFTGLGYEPTMIGYQAQQMPDRVVLQDAYYGLEQIIVSSVKLEKEAPFSFSEIKRATIKKINLGQDVPMLLQRAPSVVAHSDAGNGIGYTYLRIRGSDQTRINVTVNNIPINDSESHQVFWVNMPDIASSSSSIQIQRGVGNSNNGAGAFGASVNIQTTNTSRDPYVDLAVSGGSYGAQKYTLSASSGLLNDKFVLEGRGSYLQSDGYVDRASAELQSYYLSASYLSENSVLKLVHFGGDERTFQSWYGVPEAKLNGSLADLQNHYQTNLGSIYRSQADSLNLFNSDRRYNFYEYENQVDDYGQDHYQAHFSNQSGDLSFRTALHYTRGGGFFEEFKQGEDLADYGFSSLGEQTDGSTNLVRRRALDNHFYGLTFNIALDKPSYKLELGGAANQYIGDHFGDIISIDRLPEQTEHLRYYFSDATKNDLMVYLKDEWYFHPKWKTFFDLQFRYIDYRTEGTDNDLALIDVDRNWFFFNPKIGISYNPRPTETAYLSFSVANREPVRSDLIDNVVAPEAETLYDLELGLRHQKERYNFNVNGYAMLYENQLVPTGDLNDVGAILRTNVDFSYRIGIELDGELKLGRNFDIYGNVNVSRNKISEFDEILFDYTNGFDRQTIRHENSDIAYSPNFIGALGIVKKIKQVEIDWQHRYTAQQFLDNTQNSDRALDAFYVSNLHLAYSPRVKWAKDIQFLAQFNNIFNASYATFGYTYSYVFGDLITENFLYPQARFNWMAGVKIRF